MNVVLTRRVDGMCVRMKYWLLLLLTLSCSPFDKDIAKANNSITRYSGEVRLVQLEKVYLDRETELHKQLLTLQARLLTYQCMIQVLQEKIEFLQQDPGIWTGESL